MRYPEIARIKILKFVLHQINVLKKYYTSIFSSQYFKNKKSILCIFNHMILNDIHNRTPKSGILFTDTRETPVFSGISLALRRSSTLGATFRGPIWKTAAFGVGERRKEKKNGAHSPGPRNPLPSAAIKTKKNLVQYHENSTMGRWNYRELQSYPEPHYNIDSRNNRHRWDFPRPPGEQRLFRLQCPKWF